MLNDLSSPRALLLSRRSGRPRDLVAPGPDAAAVETMVRIAGRSPDHGKLAPWRFVHVTTEARAAFADLLQRAYRADVPEPGRLEIEANERFAHQAPTLIVALYRPVESRRIPDWEQRLSCGAACMNLSLAAHAQGFASGWVTGWAAYSPMVRDAFGSAPEEIAGFFFIGTPASPLEDRPRPALDTIFSHWRPSH